MLTVEVDNSKLPNSRWYTGSGIYRPVNLLIGNPTHIKYQGVKIATLSYEPARIRVAVSIETQDSSKMQEITVEIMDGENVVVEKSITATPQCSSETHGNSDYTAIQEESEQFLIKREQYTYSRLGAILCLLHIPHKIKNSYFCSQFVVEVLSKAGAVELKKKESLYLPGK